MKRKKQPRITARVIDRPRIAFSDRAEGRQPRSGARMKKAAKKPKKAPKVPEADPVDVVTIERWEVPVPAVSASVTIAAPAAAVSVAAPAPTTIALAIGTPARLDHATRKQIIAAVTRSASEILDPFKGKSGAPHGPRPIQQWEAIALLMFEDFLAEGNRPSVAAAKVQKAARIKAAFGETTDPLARIRRTQKRATALGCGADDLRCIADGKPPVRF